MKSLKRKFNNISQRNPYWSSYICFAETIRNKNFSDKIILYWFPKLVSPKDYLKEEKRTVISHLKEITKRSEEGIKQG